MITRSVDPEDISAAVCPIMEVTRYYRAVSDGMAAYKDRKRNRRGRERRANADHNEIEPGDHQNIQSSCTTVYLRRFNRRLVV